MSTGIITCSRSYVRMTIVNCSRGKLPPRFSLNSFPEPPHPPLIGRNPRPDPVMKFGGQKQRQKKYI